MTPQELKSSILQLAVQGKLVPQLPEEGTGEELLELLSSEKNRIIESGVLKGRKTKPLQRVSSDDIPFDIPDTWCWIRLGSVAEIFGRIGFRGYTKNDIVPEGKGAITISPSNIRPNGKTDFSDCTYLSWEKYEESPEIKVFEGDILLVKTGSSYGKCGIVCNLPEKATINPQLAILKYITCNVKYLDYVLKSPMARNQFESFVIGTSIPTFSQEKLANLLLPLPPLAEQKRIVAKIEELLPYIDRYEKAWSRLEDFNKRFPVDMQKSILQMAIQGKLVGQHPEEDTGEELYQQIQAEKQKLIKEGKIKKEKPLPEISEEEIPFEIPESWKWVRLGEISYFQGGYAYKSTSYVPDSNNQIIRLGNVKQNHLLLDAKPAYIPDSIAETTEAYLIKKDDLLVTMTGTRRKKDYLFVARIEDSDLARKKLFINQRVGCFRCFSGMDSAYLQIVLQEESIRNIIFEKETGTANQGNLGSEDMKMYIYVPLPPLAEQKRIVAKLEEILPLCERLK